MLDLSPAGKIPSHGGDSFHALIGDFQRAFHDVIQITRGCQALR